MPGWVGQLRRTCSGVAGPFWSAETLSDRSLALEIMEIPVSISIRVEASLKPVGYSDQWINRVS